MAESTKITAEPPGGDGDVGADQSLPDPSAWARWWLAGSLVVAGILAIAMNEFSLTGKSFTPPEEDTNFVLLAAFYAAAQIIERLMELVTPLLMTNPPSDTTGAARAAHVKADRSKMALGVATVIAVVVSSAFGLHFLRVIGIDTTNTIDVFATALVIGAGTKPLHDFIGLISKPTNPTTGTGVST